MNKNFFPKKRINQQEFHFYLIKIPNILIKPV